MVGDGAAVPVQRQEARRIALQGRILCDELGRELEVEVGDLQKSLFCAGEPCGATRPKC
jgi:hypothetical protein